MKSIIKTFILGCFLTGAFGLVSCSDYLDKSPDAEVTAKDAFSTFKSFQGYVEEIYYCMPDMTKRNWTSEWNWGDDIIIATNGSFRTGVDFDAGNYWAWYQSGWGQSWLYNPDFNTNSDAPYNKGLWQGCWYGIRKANVGLANLDLLTGATQAQKDVIKGQLLFFRGWLHFQLMSYFGGLPYIDYVLPSGEKLTLPRLTYRETALRVAQDLKAAAALLPANWDMSSVGQATSGNNQQRIAASAAYAALGKDYLYAASPMMNELESGVSAYDRNLCDSAALAFNEVFKLSEEGRSEYGSWVSASYTLESFENYKTIFSKVSNWFDMKIPGGNEVILTPPSMGANMAGFNLSIYIPTLIGGDKNLSAPTHNYVQNFGMANGLPLDDPNSGYNPADPWSNRDPRFRFDIRVDGDTLFRGSGGVAIEKYRKADLFTGGWTRDEVSGSRTGYMIRKFITDYCNQVDDETGKINFIVPYIRMADVYLMFAEASAQAKQSSEEYISGCNYNAIDAMNKVRDRVMPDGSMRLSPDYYSLDNFMSELRRERAVEMAFEGQRLNDLRRWNLNTDMRYRKKTAIDFDRGSNGKPINVTERVILTRVAAKKHNWLPLPVDQVVLYPGFGQNPGW